MNERPEANRHVNKNTFNTVTTSENQTKPPVKICGKLLQHKQNAAYWH